MKLPNSHALGALAVSLAACAAEPTPTPTPDPVDAGFADAQEGPPDVGFIEIPPGSVAVSGTVYRLEDYLRGDRVPLVGSTIRSLGVTGVPPTTPDDQGRFSIIVPQNGKVVFSVDKDNHVPTYEEVAIGTQSIAKNFLLATKLWVDIVAAGYGTYRTAPFNCHAPNPTNVQCKFAFVAGQLLDDGTDGAGTPAPVAGVTKDDFQFRVDGHDNWYVKGPYFLTPVGGAQRDLTASVRERDPATNVYRGGLFFAFIEIPVDSTVAHDLTIAVHTPAPNERTLGPVQSKIFLQNLAWLKLYQTAVGPVDPPVEPVTIDFDTAVYPLLQPITAGGYGCLGCHTSIGTTPAGGMDLSGGPAAAYGALDPARYPERVNLNNPAQSEVLTKPLYEADGIQDHAIFAFVSTEDPGYQAIYKWIQAGAKRVQGGPQPPPPVSFLNQVRPLLYKPGAEGGLGCVGCHTGGNPPGGFSVDGDAASLYSELTSEAATDPGGTGEAYRVNKQGEVAKSLLLLNPLQGSTEQHPVKLLPSAADARYRTLYTWISEGYHNDSL